MRLGLGLGLDESRVRAGPKRSYTRRRRDPHRPRQRKMILTTCAACAAPLAHDAPRCIRCKTRYCDATSGGPAVRRGLLRKQALREKRAGLLPLVILR
jgi:hypothetical protein